MMKNVTCANIRPAIVHYLKRMFISVRNLVASLPLSTVPAMAAEPVAPTGITGIGPAMFLFTVAAALFLTLLLRTATSHFASIAQHKRNRRRLLKALAGHGPNVLHDFILPGVYGGLVRIDHALLTSGGILCIQTKHCDGLVVGGEDEPQWSNVDGIKKRRFLNPLIQNEGRARALRQVVPKVPVRNLVVFTGSVQFSAQPPQHVIQASQLDSYISKFDFGPARVDDWDAVWMSVKAAALTDADTQKDFEAQLSFG